ncbi:triacylglycerol lipase 1 isoform X2 [Arachis ipaensis]|uniref:triacylglycerol lipase 1 isoform X2 n=1 Tax=Arachis ipaensis TaxID=130454 RepID=UPI0007AF762D|nr:triacylglycerol lipase 1 isoform X2 [Arachis ipaensis]
MARRLLAALAAISITVSVLFGDSVDCFDGGGKSEPQPTLCDELILPAGYPCSEYMIQTKDGFLLGLQRVSSSSSSLRFGHAGERGPPVLLLHGLFMAGDAWFLNTPEQSLGFILADQGFDVWVGNVRGTRWSHGHRSYSVKNKKFWDWSWQELALYDMAEMINYIYSVTNSKLFIVGHSQMVLTMGIHQLNFKSEWGTNLLVSLCDTRLSCGDMLSSITGKNCCFNESRVAYYLDQEPHPSSAKNLNHLFQMIREGTFSKYDYGKLKNVKVYGKFKPPKFDLSRIPKSLPLWMAYGGNDALADVTDVKHTLQELPSTPELVYLENYGHVDFILSLQARQDLYDPMINFFKSSGKYSSI